MIIAAIIAGAGHRTPANRRLFLTKPAGAYSVGIRGPADSQGTTGSHLISH